MIERTKFFWFGNKLCEINSKTITMKKLLIITAFGIFAYACGGEEKPAAENSAENTSTKPGGDDPAYDAKRGAGKFKDVQVSPQLNAALADKGTKVYDVKCASCHKVTTERLVGPGWAGVTQRRTADWILNFITNTEEMLAKDPEAQAQLEICLVRMPNQNLTDDEALSVYEFMRKNDGVK
ncbi:MAG: nirK [Chitinophagaceae bacterium]|jgi:mono/diheme cytochrome c family protein|nr:nirK [Chitinophagaceae bacterium]